jgi:hypothetical protein
LTFMMFHYSEGIHGTWIGDSPGYEANIIHNTS